MAPTTELSWPPDPSDGSKPPDPYPTVPAGQVRGDHMAASMVRTDGNRLLVHVFVTDCSTEEVRLTAERADRVEVEIRTVVTAIPASVGAGKGLVCGGLVPSGGPYAVVELGEPLGERAVVIDHVD